MRIKKGSALINLIIIEKNNSQATLFMRKKLSEFPI